MNEPRGRDNVEPIPVRKDLPPEIAAFALPRDDAPPLVVISTSESKPGRTLALFRNVFVGATSAFLGVRGMQWFRDHQITAALASAAVSVTAAITVTGTLDREGSPPVESRTVTTTAAIMTRSPAAVARRPTQKPPATETTRPPQRTRPPVAGTPQQEVPPPDRPASTPPVIPEAEKPTPVRSPDCAVRVDVDPLLGVCPLG